MSRYKLKDKTDKRDPGLNNKLRELFLYYKPLLIQNRLG